MKFEVVNVSRGDVRLQRDDRQLRVLGEALLASRPDEPSFVIYLNSLVSYEVPSGLALSRSEKQLVMRAIRQYFQSFGSVVEFE